ncbi:MAG: hypothetical protein ACJAZT_001727 [Gammaproteobacteria bacterium]|jgi:hypothetical protein
MLTKRSVAFKLIFIKTLISRRLMWESRVAVTVLLNYLILITKDKTTLDKVDNPLLSFIKCIVGKFEHRSVSQLITFN